MLLVTERSNQFDVTVIAPHGLGFGEGTISVKRQLESGDLDEASLHAAVEILQNDPDVYAESDTHTNDDGCGDGRVTSRIYTLQDPATSQTQTFSRQFCRAKLFGGGLIASSSMWRAVEGLPHNGQTLSGDRAFLAHELKKRGVLYGAHTDTKATGDSCGCGAIDNYERISRNITVYRDDIIATLKLLYGDDFTANESAIKDVLAMYRQLDDYYFSGVTGRSTMDFIEADGAIVKQLKGEHCEDVVVLNDVEGTTLDQHLLREKLSERGLSPAIQAFVIDVWRGRMYAYHVADLAVEHKIGIDRDTAYQRAYADFLIRTLAVSATLTRGDQLVLRRTVKPYAPPADQA